MKCIILAAGYATRLYPLTENFPKPLLEVSGKPILDWLIDDMSQTGLIDEYIVISNHKFAPIFEQWAEKKQLSTVNCQLSTLDDGTSSNETRLGAVRDIQFAIDQLNLDDDLLVMAGDNLLDFSLGDFIRYAKDKQATCVMRYYENDEARLHKTGVAEIDADGRILSMEEKPANPKSHWCIPAFYYYTRQDARLIKKGIDSGCGVDAPGSFIAWLSTQTTVYTYEMPGRRYDIGTLASYEAVKNSFPPEKRSLRIKGYKDYLCPKGTPIIIMSKKTYPPIEPESDSAKEPAPAVFNPSPIAHKKRTNTGLMADNGYSYPSKDELRNIFASSCVEAVARKLQLSSGEAYRRMKRVELFRDLIYPCYEALHSQSREVVTEDIIQALQIREAKLEEEAS